MMKFLPALSQLFRLSRQSRCIASRIRETETAPGSTMAEAALAERTGLAGGRDHVLAWLRRPSRAAAAAAFVAPAMSRLPRPSRAARAAGASASTIVFWPRYNAAALQHGIQACFQERGKSRRRPAAPALEGLGAGAEQRSEDGAGRTACFRHDGRAGRLHDLASTLSGSARPVLRAPPRSPGACRCRDRRRRSRGPLRSAHQPGDDRAGKPPPACRALPYASSDWFSHDRLTSANRPKRIAGHVEVVLQLVVELHQRHRKARHLLHGQPCADDRCGRRRCLRVLRGSGGLAG